MTTDWIGAEQKEKPLFVVLGPVGSGKTLLLTTSSRSHDLDPSLYHHHHLVTLGLIVSKLYCSRTLNTMLTNLYLCFQSILSIGWRVNVKSVPKYRGNGCRSAGKQAKVIPRSVLGSWIRAGQRAWLQPGGCALMGCRCPISDGQGWDTRERD